MSLKKMIKNLFCKGCEKDLEHTQSALTNSIEQTKSLGLILENKNRIISTLKKDVERLSGDKNMLGQLYKNQNDEIIELLERIELQIEINKQLRTDLAVYKFEL